jgi:cobyrinic acid a,c-diamide synthase
MNNSRLIIAGSRSGVGKTTLSLGLMAALTKRGYQVQPYKVGPDYIDPGFHTLITGNESYNLDSYFLGEDGVKNLFISSSVKSDISIIEGVMGLFDGKGKKGVSSTAEIAKTLQAPVILIIDAGKMAQSGAALAYGYKKYDPSLNIQGVILNNIVSLRHYRLLKEAIEDEPVNLEVMGYIPRQKELALPERHLGLVPTQESKKLEAFIDDLIQLIENNIDLEKVLNLADTSNEIDSIKERVNKKEEKINVKLGIAYDEAFNFYYQLNLELLKKRGAELVYFSPIHDTKLPEVDGIYFGGGFPESFLDKLAKNKTMKQDIKEKIIQGMPAYAECGGLMYLSESIIDKKGKIHPMVGLLPGQTEMQDSLQEMGYREITSLRNNIILDKGAKARGHVFHYSSLTNLSASINKCYHIEDDKLEGYSPFDNVLVSYLHLHFASNPDIVNNFLQRLASKG